MVAQKNLKMIAGKLKHDYGFFEKRYNELMSGELFPGILDHRIMNFFQLKPNCPNVNF